MVGEPVSACRGNRWAGCGGTARPGNMNAYLIQKVRTPSGKPGWGKTSISKAFANIITREFNVQLSDAMRCKHDQFNTGVRAS